MNDAIEAAYLAAFSEMQSNRSMCRIAIRAYRFAMAVGCPDIASSLYCDAVWAFQNREVVR